MPRGNVDQNKRNETRITSINRFTPLNGQNDASIDFQSAADFLFYKNRTFFTIQHQVPLDETLAGFMRIVKKRSIYYKGDSSSFHAAFYHANNRDTHKMKII